MDYSIFAKKATAQDKRNIFKKFDGNIDIVPDEIKPFYRNFNPIDVEIDVDGVGVRFCSAEWLHNLQNDYAYLKAQFIFASCNSDPIFINNGQVYTCPHGAKEPEWEKLADNFEIYLTSLIDTV